MAKLEGKAEAQQYEEKLKKLSNKNKSGSNTKSARRLPAVLRPAAATEISLNHGSKMH